MRMHSYTKIMSMLFFTILILITKNIYGKQQDNLKLKGIFFSLNYSPMKDPVFRAPTPTDASYPGEEFGKTFKENTLSFRIGYDWIDLDQHFGAGLYFCYWKYNFNDFDFPGRENDLFGPYEYKNPSITYWFFDLSVIWIPYLKLPGVYAFLGMGDELEKYSIHSLNKDPYSDWESFYQSPIDGKKGIFQYSYGFGLRWFFYKQFTAFFEYRWIPGDLKNTIETAGPGYYEYDASEGEVSLYSKLISIGISYTYTFPR